MVSIGETSENYLSIKFKKSSDVNDLLLNTFRRVILSELYSFAFAPTEISIPTNTSILNNDHLRHRISLLPIQSFKEKHLPNTNITVSLVQENTDDIIKTVTTDHCIVRINNIITPNMFPSPPVIICNLKESQKLILILKQLKLEKTMVLIEHDMDAVFALADRITVMVYGKIIATGSPQEIRKNQTVKHAYLGDQEL